MFSRLKTFNKSRWFATSAPFLHKIQVQTSSAPTTIDLDEMELEAFLDSIDKYVSEHYKSLIKEAKVSH